jgi:hypothetical protein
VTQPTTDGVIAAQERLVSVQRLRVEQARSNLALAESILDTMERRLERVRTQYGKEKG